MTKRSDWTKNYRERFGKKSIPIDFEALLMNKQLSVEKFSEKIGYTLDGTVRMLKRGSIKPSTFNKLKKTFSDLDEYLIKKK